MTDVGAGAGAQSRATDTHLVVRQHEQDGAVVVVDAAVRSWPPLDAFCLRWQCPLWVPAPELDPTQLRSDRRKTRKEERVSAHEPETWTAEKFVARFVGREPQTKELIVARAVEREPAGRKAE